MRIAQCSAASVTASQPAATLNRQDDNKHTLNSASYSTAQHHGDFVPAGNDRNNTIITQATPADHQSSTPGSTSPKEAATNPGQSANIQTPLNEGAEHASCPAHEATLSATTATRSWSMLTLCAMVILSPTSAILWSHHQRSSAARHIQSWARYMLARIHVDTRRSNAATYIQSHARHLAARHLATRHRAAAVPPTAYAGGL